MVVNIEGPTAGVNCERVFLFFLSAGRQVSNPPAGVAARRVFSKNLISLLIAVQYKE